MPSVSMGEALAKSKESRHETLQQKTETLALKKRAIESREVTDFIRHGGSEPEDGEEAAASLLRPSRAEGPEFAQLNTRVPKDIYARTKRAAFENDASKQEPSTMQGVIVEALSAYLKRIGY